MYEVYRNYANANANDCWINVSRSCWRFSRIFGIKNYRLLVNILNYNIFARVHPLMKFQLRIIIDNTNTMCTFSKSHYLVGRPPMTTN